VGPTGRRFALRIARCTTHRACDRQAASAVAPSSRRSRGAPMTLAFALVALAVVTVTVTRIAWIWLDDE
jgi:hypothetical protein